LDQANSAPRQRYYKAELIETGDELCRVLAQTGTRYSASLENSVYDFKSVLDPLIDNVCTIFALFFVISH
jgi:hypothetical protein